MKALDVTFGLVGSWQQGSTSESRSHHEHSRPIVDKTGRVIGRQLAHYQPGGVAKKPDDIHELIRESNREQLLRYLRKRIRERKQAALKPSLLNRITGWVRSRFVKPTKSHPNPLVVQHDEMVANHQLQKQVSREVDRLTGAYRLGQRKGARSRRNQRVRQLLQNPNLLRIVTTIESRHNFYKELMR